MFKKKVTIKEIVLGIALGFTSYILIAVFNISNEDLYNWDVALIFSEGGFANSAALIAFWFWFLMVVIWIMSIAYRLMKFLFKSDY